MRRLLLLRHAKTETDAPSGQDHDRRLDERGRSDAGEIGHWIARNPPFPNLVLVSSAVRAQQTWEFVWEAMKDRVPAPEVETLDELYGAEPTQLLKTIRMASSSDPKRLMLVGHNPGMHETALMLAGSGDKAGIKALEDNLPTSGLAVLDFDIDDWSDMAFRRGKLALFVSPKLLRQMSKD
jgi:phosphohistidine phosphatase